MSQKEWVKTYANDTQTPKLHENSSWWFWKLNFACEMIWCSREKQDLKNEEEANRNNNHLACAQF